MKKHQKNYKIHKKASKNMKNHQQKLKIHEKASTKI
jgi:hypothetical protein